MAKLLGKRGGDKTKLRHGTNYYRDIANKRWNKVKEEKSKLALDKRAVA